MFFSHIVFAQPSRIARIARIKRRGLVPVCLALFIGLSSFSVLPVWAAPDGNGRTPIWIDTDPSCGEGFGHDVDDCLALIQAFNSPELEIVGIGTVFGNTDHDTAAAIAQRMVAQFGCTQAQHLCSSHVHAGARSPDKGFVKTPATEALRRILAHRPVTILALGPLTNVATFLVNYPELRQQIVRVIAVAGRRPGQRFQPSPLLPVSLGDSNFEADPSCFDLVLRSGVPITLIPYEVAAKVTVNRQDLDDLLAGPPASQWVSEQASGWLQLWRWGLQTDGFFPFDTLAVGYVTRSQQFQCDLLSAQVVSRRGIWSSKFTLEVSKHIQNGNLVTYCYNVSPQFKVDLMQRLQAGVTAGSAVRVTADPANGVTETDKQQQREKEKI